MTYSLLWLPQVLYSTGLPVVEVPDWQTRGHGDMADIKGVLCHHTAGPKNGDAPSLPIVINGRVGLAGPLAQLFLSRSGVFHIIAAGKAWHAGQGEWNGITDGNAHLIGIEAENTGVDNDMPWPDDQIDAYARGCAALLKHVGLGADACIGHKEWAPHRKTDPSFDMTAFREAVASHF